MQRKHESLSLRMGSCSYFLRTDANNSFGIPLFPCLRDGSWHGFLQNLTGRVLKSIRLFSPFASLLTCNERLETKEVYARGFEKIQVGSEIAKNTCLGWAAWKTRRIRAIFTISRDTRLYFRNYVDSHGGKRVPTHFLMLENRNWRANFSQNALRLILLEMIHVSNYFKNCTYASCPPSPKILVTADFFVVKWKKWMDSR